MTIHLSMAEILFGQFGLTHQGNWSSMHSMKSNRITFHFFSPFFIFGSASLSVPRAFIALNRSTIWFDRSQISWMAQSHSTTDGTKNISNTQTTSAKRANVVTSIEWMRMWRRNEVEIVCYNRIRPPNRSQDNSIDRCAHSCGAAESTPILSKRTNSSQSHTRAQIAYVIGIERTYKVTRSMAA